MSIQELSEETIEKLRSTSSSVSISSHVLVAYPGESVRLTIALNGPMGHVLHVDVNSLPSAIESINMKPRASVAPFTSNVEIRVSPRATPGVYVFKLKVVDTTANTLLSLEPVTLIVLRMGMPKTLAKHYQKLKTMYRTYGAQALVWYILAHIFKNEATFTQIKHVYELVVKAPISNGTIGNTLKRMMKKRIVVERYPGVYVSNVRDFSVLLSRIDLSRVRVQANGDKRNTRRTLKAFNQDEKMNFNELPKPIKRVWKRAQQIANKHGVLAALYFLLHSLLGAEATGYLLYWLDTWFIVCRSKTGFCYHFYSVLLNEMLRRLGLRQGIQYNYFSMQEHIEAQRIAQEYIRRYYISHPNARRLHYMLKELNYIDYDNDVYTIKIYHYRNGALGLEIYDDKGQDLLHSDGVRKDDTLAMVETKSAFPFEHVDEGNEDTYFTRPAGLY